MEILYSRNFVKHYRRRIRPYPKLIQSLNLKLQSLQDDPTDSSLRNHRLSGQKKGYFAFSLTGDIRVIYTIENNNLILYDIGTHNQVYR